MCHPTKTTTTTTTATTTTNNTKNSNNNNNLRELFYDRNPGDARVKVGSERQAASSRTRPTDASVEIDSLMIWNISAGTLQNWPCYREDYSHKIPYTTVGFSVEIVLRLEFYANLDYKS